jgi:hypothetical protein
MGIIKKRRNKGKDKPFHVNEMKTIKKGQLV